VLKRGIGYFFIFLAPLFFCSCKFDQISEKQLPSSSVESNEPNPIPPSNTETQNDQITQKCPEGQSPLLDPMSASEDNPICGFKPTIEKLIAPGFVYPDRELNIEFAVSGTVQSVRLNPGQVDVIGKKRLAVRPLTSTTYTLYASNAYGTVSKTVVVRTINQIENSPLANEPCSSSSDLVSFKNTRLITEFGVVPNSDLDQSDKIQTAINSLSSGDRLLFVPGVYLHSKRINITRADVVIDGNGAEIRGTNALDKAIMIQANQVTVRNLIITGLTRGRASTPWQSGLAIYSSNSGSQRLYNIKILNNILVPLDGAGDDFQNGSGIFIYNAENYLIANNLIVRSYSDGIHSTARSKNGRILFNNVIETGDDGIAIVSYLDKSWRSKTNVDPNFLKNNYEAVISSNILIYDNFVSGQYWGRGISVVGGKNISILNNDVSKIFGAAGIYLSREVSYETTGVNNINVRGNNISKIATDVPAFIPQGSYYSSVIAAIASGPVTGHGAIEVYAAVTNTDYAYPAAADALTAQNINIEKNNIIDTKWAGLRIGYNSVHMQGVNLIANTVSHPGGVNNYMLFKTDVFDKTPHCSLNKTELGDLTSTFCLSTVVKYSVSGFLCYL